jgi:hypothetical protein
MSTVTENKMNVLGRFIIGTLFLTVKIGITQEIVITELYRDPPGAESALCGGASHEFVEFLNIGIDTFWIDNLFLSDGMESDSIIPLKKAPSFHQNCIINRKYLCPGQFALILDPDYSELSIVNDCAFAISDSTILVQTGDKELGNGLSSDDGVVLYKGTKKEIIEIIAAAADSSALIQSPAADKISLSSVTNREGFSIELQGIISGKNFSISSAGTTPGWSEYFKGGHTVEYRLGEVNEISTSVSCTLYCLSTIN